MEKRSEAERKREAEWKIKEWKGKEKREIMQKVAIFFGYMQENV